MAAPIGKDTYAVLDVVRQFGGPIRVSEVMELMPDTASSIIVSVVDQLVKWSCVSKQMVAKRSGNGQERMISFVKSIEERTSGPTAPTSTGLQAQLDEALAKVAELEAWQEAAIRKYPDLGVDPAVLEARRLVADTLRESGDKHGADEVMSGKRDHTPLMKVAMRALGGDVP